MGELDIVDLEEDAEHKPLAHSVKTADEALSFVLDPAYTQWRAEFAYFEARCFEALCDFVRMHFDDLLDRYYWEGHESFNEFPAWALERYLRDVDRAMQGVK
jgi:hypothetical protein